MTRGFAILALTLVGAGACSTSDRPTLRVDLRTDLGRSLEVTGFRARLLAGPEPTERDELVVVERLFDPAADYENGVRLAELEGLDTGRYWLEVSAIRLPDEVVVSRLHELRLDGNLSFTTVLSSRCVGVVCEAGQTCSEGACVDPSCAGADCATVDLGAPPDSGGPDLGPPDLGPPDLGPSGYGFDPVEPFEGPAPCSAATRDCVAGCSGDLAFVCIEECLLDDADHQCWVCHTHNATACRIAQGCQEEWDRYAACAEERCVTPHTYRCWTECEAEASAFAACGTGCPDVTETCFP